MKIREDVQILPIEINVQSAGVSQQDPIFYTNDDDEIEEQSSRKAAIRQNPGTDETATIFQSITTNLIKRKPEIEVRLLKTNQIIIEQSKEQYCSN